MRNIAIAAIVLVLLGVVAAGADVAGLWKAIYDPPDGHKHETTLDLQVDAGKITGKIFSNRGSVPIDEGTVNGNAISFSVTRKGNGDEIKVDFTGTVENGTMRLKMQYRDRKPVELIAKRGS